LKQIKKRKIAYKTLKHSKHTKGKQHIEIKIKKYGKKKLILFKKKIPLYSPQRYKALNTSKKKVKKGGTCS